MAKSELVTSYMKAIIRTATGPSLQVVPMPVITRAKDVLVRVKATSICRTDLYAAFGEVAVPNGRVLGHEFTGVVMACGAEVVGFSVGSRVVCNPFLPCGICTDCESGLEHHCADSSFIGLEHDGAFAEFIVVSENSLSLLPERISFSVGTYIEPVAAGFGILEAQLVPTQRILILGSGRICRLTEAILRDAGFQHLSSVAAEELHLVSTRFDVVIETQQVSDVLAVLDVLRPRGLLVLKSRNPSVIEFPTLELIRKQIRIIAVKYGKFEDAISYALRHSQELSSSLDVGWKLDDFELAFFLSKQSEEKKVCFNLDL